MEILFRKAREDKVNDIRLVERRQQNGNLDEKARAKFLESLEDCASLAETVNVDDIMANDNPVHVARNLPSTEPRAIQPFEELEFEEAARLKFEH